MKKGNSERHSGLPWEIDVHIACNTFKQCNLVSTLELPRPYSFPSVFYFDEILTKTDKYKAILSGKMTIFVSTLAVRLMGIKATFLGNSWLVVRSCSGHGRYAGIGRKEAKMYHFCALPRFWTISLLPDYQEVIAKPQVFRTKELKDW